MVKTINIDKNPYDERLSLFSSNKVEIKPGMTVLVGCNGIGKTTLLRIIGSNHEKTGIPTIEYNNLRDGGANARIFAGSHGDFRFLAAALCSSEGENIVMNLQKMAGRIGVYIHDNPHISELWLLLDATDSGLSIDNIVEFKNFLKRMVIGRNRNKDIYILISANEYGMANGKQCLDLCDLEYITFADYEEYKTFILKSREIKDSVR